MFSYSAVSSRVDRSKCRQDTSPHGRSVHSDTNSASLGSIQTWCNYCAKTIHLHFHHCLKPGTHLYSWVNWGIVERTRMSKLRNSSKGDSNTGSLNIIVSPSFYRWVTAVDFTLYYAEMINQPSKILMETYLVAAVDPGECWVISQNNAMASSGHASQRTNQVSTDRTK